MADSGAPQPEVRARLLISGRVQGVGYRISTLEAAQRLSLRGWVRNLPDGRVEAVLEGLADPVLTLIRWCKQGPPAADVHSVTVTYEAPVGEETFRIQH